MVGETYRRKGRNVEIPNWVKWAGLIGLVIWLITDPKGLATVVGNIGDGVVTFFKELG